MSVDYRDRPDLPSFLTLRELSIVLAYVAAIVEAEGHDTNAQIGILVRGRGRDGVGLPAPWVEFSVEGREFGIWRTTLEVFEADEHGAMGDEPIKLPVRGTRKAVEVDEHAERWRMLAKHHLGDITDDEYADYLESLPDHDPDDPVEMMIIDRLRGRVP